MRAWPVQGITIQAITLKFRENKTAVYACIHVSIHACIYAYIHHLLWCTDFPSNCTNILIVWTDYSSEHAFPCATLPPPPPPWIEVRKTVRQQKRDRWWSWRGKTFRSSGKQKQRKHSNVWKKTSHRRTVHAQPYVWTVQLRHYHYWVNKWSTPFCTFNDSKCLKHRDFLFNLRSKTELNPACFLNGWFDIVFRLQSDLPFFKFPESRVQTPVLFITLQLLWQRSHNITGRSYP